MKRVLRAIIKFLEGPSPTSLGGILDSYELCGWSKCPLPEKKEKIECYFNLG